MRHFWPILTLYFFSNSILKIHDIYKLNIGLYMYHHNSSAHYSRLHDYETRGHGDLLPMSARITLTQNSISVVGPNIWNSIPEDIQNSPSYNCFKFRYKKFLLSFYTGNQNWLTHLSRNICAFIALIRPIYFRIQLPYYFPNYYLYWMGGHYCTIHSSLLNHILISCLSNSIFLLVTRHDTVWFL